MDEAGKVAAASCLGALRTLGQTNIWAGLHTGMEALKEGARLGRTSSLMLLTDGQPNIVRSPPRKQVITLDSGYCHDCRVGVSHV